MDPVRPEIAVISQNGVSIFELWRSTAGLNLHDLEIQRDVGMIIVPDQKQSLVPDLLPFGTACMVR